MVSGRPSARTREIHTLLDRLQEFEALRPTDTDRTIIEVGKASIRERLAMLARDRRDRPRPAGPSEEARRAG